MINNLIVVQTRTKISKENVNGDTLILYIVNDKSKIDYHIKNKLTKYKFSKSLKIRYIKKEEISKCPIYYFVFFRIISAFIKCILKRLLIFIFIKFPIIAVSYIRNQPVGLKQNTIIKENLANVFVSFNICQMFLFDNFYIFSCILKLDLFFIKMNLLFIFNLYKFIISTLYELLNLFSNKTYNNIKKRNDTLILNNDQIILGVIIFSIFILTLINILPFYIFYVIIYFCYKGINLLETFINILRNYLLDDSFKFKLLLRSKPFTKKINIKNLLLGKIKL